METLYILIKYHFLQRLIWVYTVCSDLFVQMLEENIANNETSGHACRDDDEDDDDDLECYMPFSIIMSY